MHLERSVNKTIVLLALLLPIPIIHISYYLRVLFSGDPSQDLQFVIGQSVPVLHRMLSVALQTYFDTRVLELRNAAVAMEGSSSSSCQTHFTRYMGEA